MWVFSAVQVQGGGMRISSGRSIDGGSCTCGVLLWTVTREREAYRQVTAGTFLSVPPSPQFNINIQYHSTRWDTATDVHLIGRKYAS